jgi:pimeloyl-ACP methyl ester carboxylesterase
MERLAVETPQATIAVEAHGPAAGPPVILLHGWPYSPRDYDAVAPALAAEGRRVLVPHLRGFGGTRLRPGVPRSGAQAALGADLLALMDALGIARAVLAGFDWGGRAACVVAALHPERCAGLLSCTGYAIQDIAANAAPAAPEQEARWWYQYYLHGARGARGLAENRRGLARLLWRMWSPHWAFSDADFEAAAAAWDNPDFVEVTVHSYRHRFGLVPGDPAHDAIEAALATRPRIAVPALDLHGAADGVNPPRPAPHPDFARRVLPGVGHNPPAEAPAAFQAGLREIFAGSLTKD